MSSFTEAQIVALPRKPGERQMYDSGPVEWYWELGWKGSGICVRVPPHTITDGPSVPIWLKWLFGWLIEMQSLMKSSFVHDNMRAFPEFFTLLESNATFLMCMETEKTRPLLRNLAFLAVCLNKNRKLLPDAGA